MAYALCITMKQINPLNKGILKMKIKVEVKHVYGKKLIYPACEKAELLCDLMKTKTIPSYDVELIKKLGIKIEVKQQTL